MSNSKFLKSIVIVVIGFSLSACASSGDTVYDPFEPVNRIMFNLTRTIDKAVLKPVAQAYGHVPKPVRNGVRNFFNNLSEPYTFTNDLLQGEAKRAGTSSARFVINSTIGLAGLIDVASDMGLHAHKEDFGQTLGFYGIAAGPYIFIPILGPTNFRDGVGRIITNTTNQATYDHADIENDVIYAGFAINSIDLRERHSGLFDDIERSSVDYYATVRNLYSQNRRGEIDNGKTNIDDLPDLDEFDEFDDYEETPATSVAKTAKEDYK